MHQPVYIISDLHLCDGGPRDDFDPIADDTALAAFLDHLLPQPPALLVINGDFMDFVQVQPRSTPPMWYDDALDCTEAESLEKLEAVMRAHATVFDALGRWVAAGHALRWHLGNHDIDLVWPRLQQRLAERLTGAATHPALSWGEALEVAGLYVEHGHRADPANSFPGRVLIENDATGTPRLARCWGTRLVEEFYNEIEALPGCDMLDNARPMLGTAVQIILHSVRTPSMHPTLKTGLKLIINTLAALRTTQDANFAAAQIGLRQSWQIRGLFLVAGFFQLGNELRDAWASLGTLGDGDETLDSAALRRAYAEGASITSTDDLAAALDAAEAADAVEHTPRPGVLGGAEPQATARQFYDDVGTQSFVQLAAACANEHPGVQVVCFGHTHRVIGTPLRVDDQPGWPLPNSRARYYNSGSWTASLDLDALPANQRSFAALQDRSLYRRGRDYLKVTWPGGMNFPQVEERSWQ